MIRSFHILLTGYLACVIRLPYFRHFYVILHTSLFLSDTLVSAELAGITLDWRRAIRTVPTVTLPRCSTGWKYPTLRNFARSHLRPTWTKRQAANGRGRVGGTAAPSGLRVCDRAVACGSGVCVILEWTTLFSGCQQQWEKLSLCRALVL